MLGLTLSYCPIIHFLVQLSCHSDEPAPKRIKLPTTVLGDQTALDTKGEFVNVGQKTLAGFSAVESLLFVRSETVELWNALNDTGDKNLSVDGPPGTGKSTEAWAWALWKAKKDNVTVTWYHLTKNGLVKLVIDGTLGQITTGYDAELKDIKTSQGSVLIVDGVIASKSFEVRSACCSWGRGEKGRRFVLVSSASVVIAAEQDDEANIVNFTVASWTFEQYEVACRNEQFIKLVKINMKCPGLEGVDDKDQLLLAKYHFAGGCARWMFEFTYEKWLRDFTAHLEKVSDYAILFGVGGGEQTADAVNHLRGVTVLAPEDKKYFFISQFAAGELAKKCDDKRKFLIDSYKKAKDTENPAFEGWIFEFDVDNQLATAHRDGANFLMTARQPTVLINEQLRVDDYKEFQSAQVLCAVINLLPPDKVLWAKPKLWCQKAYDFLCIWKVAPSNDLNMVVVNATLAKKHSVLLDEVKKLATELRKEDCVVSAIRFDFIVPTHAEFTIGEITGRLCEWKNLQGSQWPNAPTAASYTDCLAVVEVSRTS